MLYDEGSILPSTIPVGEIIALGISDGGNHPFVNHCWGYVLTQSMNWEMRNFMNQYHWEWGLALRMPYLIWQETVYAQKLYANHDLVLLDLAYSKITHVQQLKFVFFGKGNFPASHICLKVHI